MIPMRRTRACTALAAVLLIVTCMALAEESDCRNGDGCEQAESNAGVDNRRAGSTNGTDRPDCDNGQGCESAGSAEGGGKSADTMSDIVGSNCDIEDVCKQVKLKKKDGKSLTRISSATQEQCSYEIKHSKCPLDQVIEHCWSDKKSTKKVVRLCEE